MTPSIINTNNENLNIKYNERLVKDIRKDEREKTLKEVEEIIDYYEKEYAEVKFRGFSPSFKNRINKLREKK